MTAPAPRLTGSILGPDPSSPTAIPRAVQRHGLQAVLQQLSSDGRRTGDQDKDSILAEYAHEMLSLDLMDPKVDPALYVYTHSAFCITCLPHARPKNDPGVDLKGLLNARRDRLLENSQGGLSGLTPPAISVDREPEPYKVDTGRGTLHVRPMRHPITERYYGVPYGSAARLLLLRLQTVCKQTKSRHISLGRSASDFLGQIGLASNKPMRFNIADQINRLASCQFTFLYDRGEQLSSDGKIEPATSGFYSVPVIAGAEYVEITEDGLGKWATEAVLSREFADALDQHAVPLLHPGIARIQDSPLSVDIYCYLAYRLRSLSQRPLILPWSIVAKQFGHTPSRWFKQEFQRRLREVCAVYPEANVEISDQGLVMRHSPPPVPEETRIQVKALGRPQQTAPGTPSLFD